MINHVYYVDIYNNDTLISSSNLGNFLTVEAF